MKSTNNKVKSGVFWFSIFIIIIFVGSILANRNSIKDYLSCTQLNECLVNLTSIETRKRTLTSSRIFNNSVVEEESTVINVIENVSPSVVSIIVKTVGFDFFSGPYTTEDGIGTGFIVDSSGVIITNSHVVDDPNGEYSIVLKDGSTYEVENIHLDQITDLAIVEVTAQNLPAVELGDSDSLKVGQTAVAIGNALGRFDNTVTVGVVSGIARELTATGAFGSTPKTYESVIQTDAALNPGNSGGPLLNSAGQVIGINVATTRGADNIGFAIPVNTLKPLLASYIEEGRIVRPYIGIAYAMISEDIASIRRLPVGAFIQRVLPNSPADKAGLKRGDIIIKIDKMDVTAKTSIGNVINNGRVGDKLDIVVDREGEDVNLTIELEEAPENL